MFLYLDKAMSTYLVSGTSRGLGQGIIQIVAKQPAEKVCKVSLARAQSSPAQTLQDIDFAANLVAIELNGTGLDFLFNNAAVRDDWTPNLEDMDYLSEALGTNVVGTHRLTVAFLPLRRQGQEKKIVNFSSTLRAITTAQTDSSLMSVKYPAYKISKASAHMLTALWSNQLRAEGFCIYMQSPGSVKTDLAGGEKADLHVEVSARQVVEIAQMARPEGTGRHRNVWIEGWEQGGGIGGRYDGEDLPF
ncbi:hypothetical protein LTR95_001014 [Oleoguttula sp. CCFEE 5521]